MCVFVLQGVLDCGADSRGLLINTDLIIDLNTVIWTLCDIVLLISILLIMATSNSTSLVAPLKGANFPTWKIQCKMSLMKDGLWSIVSGTEVPPAALADRKTHEAFVLRRDKAVASIVLAVDPSLLYVLGDD